MYCGSAHCRGGHVWIHEGTEYEQVNSINCGAHGFYTQEEMDISNSLEYAKALHEYLLSSPKKPFRESKAYAISHPEK